LPESGEALRAGGPPGLLGALLVARAQKLYQNPSGSDRVSWLLFDQVWKLCQNPMDSDRESQLKYLG
jgi:hypothetical protein